MKLGPAEWRRRVSGCRRALWARFRGAAAFFAAFGAAFFFVTFVAFPAFAACPERRAAFLASFFAFFRAFFAFLPFFLAAMGDLLDRSLVHQAAECPVTGRRQRPFRGAPAGSSRRRGACCRATTTAR